MRRIEILRDKNVELSDRRKARSPIHGNGIEKRVEAIEGRGEDKWGEVERGREERKIRGWGREINATTFNFWFRLEGRIFAESEVFKRG